MTDEEIIEIHNSMDESQNPTKFIVPPSLIEKYGKERIERALQSFEEESK